MFSIRRSASLLAVLIALVAASRADAGINTQASGNHAVVALTMHFDAPKARTTGAFGPLSERQWAPDFKPVFAYPNPPAQLTGAVFTTDDGRVWLLHDFDTATGLVQYVVIGRDLEMTLTIRVAGTTGGSTATMVCDITALDDKGAAHLTELQEHAHELSAHMQHAIAAYLNQPAK
jgi:hypothetical protein